MDDPRYHTARWRTLRQQILQRDGRVCSVTPCHSPMNQPGQTHVDHIVEITDGGSFWDPHNLHVLCKRHHFAKTLNEATVRGNPSSPNA